MRSKKYPNVRKYGGADENRLMTRSGISKRDVLKSREHLKKIDQKLEINEDDNERNLYYYSHNRKQFKRPTTAPATDSQTSW